MDHTTALSAHRSDHTKGISSPVQRAGWDQLLATAMMGLMKLLDASQLLPPILIGKGGAGAENV